MKSMAIFLAVLLVLSGCESAMKKNAELVAGRIRALNYLSNVQAFTCRVETSLSAPAMKKYLAEYPDEKRLIETWDESYQWEAHEGRCEIRPDHLTPLIANHRAFMEISFCTLMQVFWVNSPFDGLNILPNQIQDRDNQVFLQQSQDSDTGIYLDKAEFRLQTRTVHNGELAAHYEKPKPTPLASFELPVRLSQKTDKYSLVLDRFNWSPLSTAVRPFPASFWISIQTAKGLEAFSGVQISDCHSL